MPGEPSVGNKRRVHSGVGDLQCENSGLPTHGYTANFTSSTRFTFTASRAGSRLARSALSTTATGSSRNMGGSEP